MKRAALERARTIRTWQRHLARHTQPQTCVCEFQAGRFRKGQRIGGCGQPRCHGCHGDKLARLDTMQERRAAEGMREGLAELRRRARAQRSDD